MKNKERKKGQYQVTLDKEIVVEAKSLQKKMVGGENLSSLLNTLLGEWIIKTKEIIVNIKNEN